MLPLKIIQQDYTATEDYFQLVLPLNIESIIPKDDSVRLLRQMVERMNLSRLNQSYSRIGKNQATPRQLLSIVLYAYMNCIYSTRDIERACKRDINFMYLLEGKHAPDHATIARFRNKHFAPIAKEILAQHVDALKELGEISLENIFIDGTKIESVANKYTFVWKKAVLKNREKMLAKIPKTIEQIVLTFNIVGEYNQIKLHVLKRLRRKLRQIQHKEDISFVRGKGKRKTDFQRLFETLDNYIIKLKDYTYKLHVCGSRNSFAKTDHDATFMRMKEDYMCNGQLKPGYNIQFGVDAEYVTWVTQGPQPTDTTTLIPFLEDLKSNTGIVYPNVVADAGYESEENYAYLEEHKQTAYIKTTDYETRKKRATKKDIGRQENMVYSADTDTYTCANGKTLEATGTRNSRTKTGYISQKTCYECKDCQGCSFKTKCIKGNNSKKSMEERHKRFELSKQFLKYRKADYERICSEKGKRLRMNRSIQAEGSFGYIKADMSFRRFLCRGKNNILAEIILLAIAHNINKLHNKIQAGTTHTYLFALKSVA